MQFDQRQEPPYTISAPIAIGEVRGTPIDLSGGSICFSVSLGLGIGTPLRIDRTGIVNRAEPTGAYFLPSTTFASSRKTPGEILARRLPAAGQETIMSSRINRTASAESRQRARIASGKSSLPK